MTTLVIDTLKISTKLKSRGFTDEQALGFVEALQEVNLDQLTTKKDLLEAKYEILKWMFSGFMALVVLLVGILVKLN